ncbi:MAG: hypothetical protein KDI07_04200 [Anaerolineae bacterium]|nr:hypothetical protein [Anaerolineae bacterium]MCB9132136.1 hypothetical protein [Anaerolineales bacterium]
MPGPSPATNSDINLNTTYAPAFIDRFARLVDQLPVPVWVFYLLLLVAGYLFFGAIRLLTGYQQSQTLTPAPALIWDVSILALHQYLDGYALRALASFNKTLGASDERLAQLGRRLTVLPLRLEVIGAVFWVLLALVLVWVQLGSFLEYFAPWEILISLTSFAIGGAFFVHIIYQLRLVSRIHASAANIDLFDPEPLYSFSRLTMRTAIGFVVLQYLVLLVLPGEIRISTVLIPVVSATGLAVVFFVWPLWGMHRRLVANKERIEGGINALLKQSVDELAPVVRSGVPEDIERLEKSLSALRAGKQAVGDLPTWPWQPRTVRGFATALLLPIFLWLIQELLARVAGF